MSPPSRDPLSPTFNHKQILISIYSPDNNHGRRRVWQRQVLVWKCVLGGTRLGDPELLTLKDYRVIHNADLLLYDRLVSNDVLKLVDSGARLLYLGKTAGYHSRTQVFGRDGEEMDFLRQQGIEVNPMGWAAVKGWTKETIPFCLGSKIKPQNTSKG
ncbi:unnamed protein product [Prunus armeniaca]